MEKGTRAGGKVKILTPNQIINTVEEIVTEREKRAKAVGDSFNGVSSEELLSELNMHLGEEWAIKKDSPMRLTKEDMNAVANSRFYRKSGIKILLIFALLFMIVLTLMSWFPSIHPYIYYGVLLAELLTFIWYYGKKQKRSRDELWGQIEGDGIEPEDSK